MPKNLKDLILPKISIIDIRECYTQTGIQEILETLDREFVGLSDVKKRLHEISSVLLFDRIRELQGLPGLDSSLHMAFTGQSGTGKSSIASKIALVLRNLGYLTKGHILNVTREDLVGQYVGHTAPKTKESLQRAQGGILFIDKANHLYKPENERDYGSEAIELFLQVMENQRQDLILIFAGEKLQIDQFFHSNPGISSRIGNHIDFKNYCIEDLMMISHFLLENQSRYKFAKDTSERLFFYISKLVLFPTFSNARTIKLLLNQLLSYQSVRVEKMLATEGFVDYETLITIQKDDFCNLTETNFINIIGSDYSDSSL